MKSPWMRASFGLVVLLAVAAEASAQAPQYQLLDLGEPVGGTGAFQYISARISSGGQVIAPVALAEGRITREWDALNGWRGIAGPSASLPYSDAAAVNAFGTVVGRLFDGAGTVLHAFVWIDGVTFDLNALAIQGVDGWVLEYANDINDSGMILGRGNIAGREHDFVLIPSPSTNTTVGIQPK